MSTTTKKQRGQKLHFDNLDEVLKSSPRARKLGQQQFETPSLLAEALMRPLPATRVCVADLQCGHGALLRAAAQTCPERDTRTLLGLDIDPTAEIPDFASKQPIQRGTVCADFTRFVPLLLAVKARFDLLVLNPPFSLQWDIADLREREWTMVNGRLELANAAIPHSALRTPTFDSTLATFEVAHRLLSKRGEGLLICNAATCDRLLVPHALWRKTWLRLTMPNPFPGVLKSMEISVVYFAAGHRGQAPLEVRAADTMPGTITRALDFAAANRHKLIEGDTVKKTHEAYWGTTREWEAAEGEWKRLTDAEFAERNGWNIRLSPLDGTVKTYLTPFQDLTGDVPQATVDALRKIEGQHPAALVVQRVSRKALVLAAQGGIWRVQPAVATAVAEAMRNYNAVRAPLRPLGPVQRLGYLDEEDGIRCERPPGLGFTAGQSYPIESETIAGRKVEMRPHWRRGEKGDKEKVLVTGQELLLRIKDANKEWHAFTQYPLGAEQERERPEKHFHLLSELVECFHIPDVPDIAQCHPAEFAEYQRRLRALEHA